MVVRTAKGEEATWAGLDLAFAICEAAIAAPAAFNALPDDASLTISSF